MKKMVKHGCLGCADAICDECVPKGHDAFISEVTAAREVWLEENPDESGADRVTPFDRFLYAPTAEAAQVGELPPLPEWSKRDDLGGLVPSEIRTELRAYARAAIAALRQPSDESIWREGWAMAYSDGLYRDDGELQDNTTYPFIDWRRDSAATIRDKIIERGKAKLATPPRPIPSDDVRQRARELLSEMRDACAIASHGDSRESEAWKRYDKAEAELESALAQRPSAPPADSFDDDSVPL